MRHGVAVGGGFGFIGRHVCTALRAVGLSPSPFGEDQVSGACDVLVWAAGYGRDPSKDLEKVHVDEPLRAFRASGARQLIYISSGEVYGRASIPFREDIRPQPLTAYGRAKLKGETTLLRFAKTNQRQLTVLRPGVVYGPGQRHNMLIPTALDSLSRDHTFATSPGTQTRDWLYVSDFAALILACIGNPKASGVFNAGTGREASVRDVLLKLSDTLGADPALLQLGAIPVREQEALRYVFDVSKVGAALGWQAFTSVDEGLRLLVAAR